VQLEQLEILVQVVKQAQLELVAQQVQLAQQALLE
jgi:hypothetical protein